ncbi:Ropporin-1-like protein [Dinochytrium kinnereticum]|nr:Ropporin-1-like protein [Dinochytrium kinnereticum]
MAEFAPASKEPLYCAEQIKIPSDLPDILKNYTKHIIRTQPTDILGCSAEYFGRLAKQRTQAGKKVTTMQLEGFYQKFVNMDRPNVHKKEIEEVCVHLSITISQFNEMMTLIGVLGGWQSEKIPWIKFWALLVASASGTFHATVETVGILLNDNGNVPTPPLLEVVNFLAERDPEVDKGRVSVLVQGLQGAGSKIPQESLMELIRRPATAASNVRESIAEKHVEPAHVEETNVHQAEEETHNEYASMDAEEHNEEEHGGEEEHFEEHHEEDHSFADE